ncbi:MAG: Rid family hydrolase [Bacteroidales bacterium]|nr:Rid family hydrolase [Bacteroidales bacterium]
MEFKTYSYPEFGVYAEVSTCKPANGIAEHSIMLHSTRFGETFKEQLEGINQASLTMEESLWNNHAKPIFKRYFLSDASNQTATVEETISEFSPCAVSIVQQPPFDGSKVALWVYLQEGIPVPQRNGNGTFSYKRNDLTHYWTAYRHTSGGNSEQQTRSLLEGYEEDLTSHKCNIVDNCVRTWFFVRDVDTNYAGVVRGRRDNFDQVGLTQDTHYIASTGIQGAHADGTVKVLLDAYAIKGLKKGQMSYLYAPTHLNPTYEYGVTFERGVCMEYGDRRQLYISGTASIDNKGNVLHVGDIEKQTLRMWENVATLLQERDHTMDDIAQMIVYLRDVADYPLVKKMYDERFPQTPKVIVLAPVCRPTWLIEMECFSIKEYTNTEYNAL